MWIIASVALPLVHRRRPRQPNTECSSPSPPLLLSVFELRRSDGTANSRSGNVTAASQSSSSSSQQSQSGKLHAMHAAFLFKQNLKKQASPASGRASERASEATFTNFATAAPRSLCSTARSHLPWDRCENFTNFAAGHLGFCECFRRNGKTAMRNATGF